MRLIFIALLAFCLGPRAEEVVGTWSSAYTHPMSYTGRQLVRGRDAWYAGIRVGNNVGLMRRDSLGAWSQVATLNAAALSGREGDCVSLAEDSAGNVLAAFYSGSGPDLCFRRYVPGAGLGPVALVRAAVDWGTSSEGGPFLHVARDRSLHVAFSDSGDRPYYARSLDSGASWTVERVSTLSAPMARPTVLTTLSGLAMVSFTPDFPVQPKVFARLPGGWVEKSPSGSGIGSSANARLYGDSALTCITTQRISPTRAILLACASGDSLAWSPWRAVTSGTGADATVFWDAGNLKHVIWRQYDTDPLMVKHSSGDTGFAFVADVTPAVGYIEPQSYWSEYWRHADSAACLLPRTGDNKIIFQKLGLALRSLGPVAPPPPPPPPPPFARGSWFRATDSTLYALTGLDAGTVDFVRLGPGCVLQGWNQSVFNPDSIPRDAIDIHGLTPITRTDAALILGR